MYHVRLSRASILFFIRMTNLTSSDGGCRAILNGVDSDLDAAKQIYIEEAAPCKVAILIHGSQFKIRHMLHSSNHTKHESSVKQLILCATQSAPETQKLWSVKAVPPQLFNYKLKPFIWVRALGWGWG